MSHVNLANTHVIFLGDNGTVNEVIQPPFPNTRGKNTLYEGGIHVPLVIAGPAVAAPNRTNATPANMVDVFATILEIAGINVAATVPPNVTKRKPSVSRKATPIVVWQSVFGESVPVPVPSSFIASVPSVRSPVICCI